MLRYRSHRRLWYHLTFQLLYHAERLSQKLWICSIWYRQKEASNRQTHRICCWKAVSFRRCRNRIGWLLTGKHVRIMKIYPNNFLAFRSTTAAAGWCRNIHTTFLPEPFYPVIKCSWFDVMFHTLLMICQTTLPALHDETVLLFSRYFLASHEYSSINWIE